MLILIICTFILLSILLLFIYNNSEFELYIKNYSNISFVIICIGAFLGYNLETIRSDEEKKNNYSQNIIDEFSNIDEYFLKYYDDLEPIFNIIYNRVNLPSSNKININLLFDKLPNKSKDITFILMNKITYLLEKIYIFDNTLFENYNLGYKIRLYIDNIIFYQYWRINYLLFDNNFYNFMEHKYEFLKINKNKNIITDDIIYNVPNTNGKIFI